ncbi:MAG: heme ABC transporter permease CcmC [Pseudomonadota bacterium]
MNQATFSSRFKRWFHQWGSPESFFVKSRFWEIIFGLFGAALLLMSWTWGLFFAPPDYLQGDSFRIIYIHVPTASAALTFYFLMGISSAIFLIWRMKLADHAAASLCIVGGTLTTISLITGSIWGKPTWGTYWQWDARLTSMLILLLLFLGVAMIRQVQSNSDRIRTVACFIAVIGMINLPIIKYSVEWWNTLHQPATLSLSEKPKMHISMLIPLLMGITGMYFFSGYLVIRQTRYHVLKSCRRQGWVKRLVKNGAL